ncbi:hypothetical protein Ngar_c02970 [Candidatus Nitrososphaera gargensis Ga9.2]|uniref:Uncharacterized protein n=1 Tax=Nitrososphaera gargensis (strain Ga9.2) TaxID=1237085 RepID=K0ICF2_NITGG|nr:hypothetical protein [Candidatus Nitrososphaera gargensis]AFU57245.1 hypothetical protein Ngar_c02970 [Candidatus Nitrososphaera gargensis Ga9.2]
MAELDPSTFSGGDETNPFLKARGFDIVLMSDALDTEELKEALQEQEHDFAPVLKRYLEDKFSIKVNKIGRANLQLPSRTVIHGKGSKNYSKDPRTKIYWFGLDEDIFNEFITNPKFFLCILLDNPATTYVLPKNIVLKIFKGKPTKKRPGRDTERWLFAIRIKEDKCILKLNNVDEVNDITPFLNKWDQIDDFKNSGIQSEAQSPSSDTYLLLRKEKPIDYNDPEFDAGPDNPNRSRLKIGAYVVVAGRKGEQTVLYGYGQIKSNH